MASHQNDQTSPIRGGFLLGSNYFFAKIQATRIFFYFDIVKVKFKAYYAKIQNTSKILMSKTKSPTTRSAAVATGSKSYFTGKVCKNGHQALRHTSSGSCSQCVAEWKASERAHLLHIRNTMEVAESDGLAPFPPQNKQSIMNRNKAIQSGLVLYYTGKKCGSGHLSERYTTSGECKSCVVIRAQKRAKEMSDLIMTVRRQVATGKDIQ